MEHIESGIASEKTEVIENPLQTEMLFLHLINSAKAEIATVFPSLNSVTIQEKIGAISLLKQKGSEQLIIRILSSLNDEVKKILEEQESEIRNSKNLLVREIARQQDMKSIILMVDRKHLLAMELNDDSAETFNNATGQATYSTSKPTVLSNLSIFESLWIQTELYDNLRSANEKLEMHDKMQKEFINVAAHELRTPTQAISGYLEMIEETLFPSIAKYDQVNVHNIQAEFENISKDNIKFKEFADGFASIHRNAQRLEKLVSDILDVSRIESNRLKIHKEYFNINQKMTNVIKDIQGKTSHNRYGGIYKNTKISFKTEQDPITVFADKIRIFEVVSNLISNAIKFSDGELIEISKIRRYKRIKIKGGNA